MSRLLLNPDYPASYAEMENYYDAAHYVLYAVAAATHKPEPTGNDVLAGLLRIIDPAAAPVSIGPESIGEQVQQLYNDADHRFQLIATMGPPDFDAENDRREIETSAWCLEQVPAETVLATECITDVPRYDPVLDELVGEFPCFAGF